MLRMFLVITLLLLPGKYLPAQDSIRRQPHGIYHTWITPLKSNDPVKGVLYEIKDSSIVVSLSYSKPDIVSGKFLSVAVPVGNIDMIRARHRSSVSLWTSAGITAGIATSMAAAKSMEDGFFGELSFAGRTLLVCVPLVPIGACLGAWIGSTKSVVPVHGSLEEYRLNQARLQKYSFVRESGAAVNSDGIDAYRHRSYIGYIFGPSFPLGAFKDKSGSLSAGGAATGSGGNFTLGYRITPRFGLAMLAFDLQFDVPASSLDEWWGIGGIMLGPMYSVPFMKRMYLDLKPMAGFTNVQRIDRENILREEYTAWATAMNMSLSYNLSKRWSAIAEPGIVYSRLNRGGGNYREIASVNLDFGIAYRFR